MVLYYNGLMKPNKIVVPALLLSAFMGTAAAAEDKETEHHSKNARKALIVLNAMGLDHPEMLNLVKSVDNNIKDGYLLLSERRAMGGTLTLHYELSGGVTAKQLELRFQPEDSRLVYTARPNAAMVNYKYNF